MQTKTLKINGMTCSACVKAVERASKKVNGVVEASVNIATEKMNVTFDETLTSVKDIQTAVEKAGYQALVETTTKTLKLQGMSCAACAKNIERVSKKLDGVIEANVNYATEKLTITFESSKVRLTDIKKAIKKSGYSASEEETTIDQDKQRKENEIKAMWRRFIISVVFTVPLLMISMGHMLGYMLPTLIDAS